MSFWEHLRFQFAAETESSAVALMRFYAAGLNVVGGIYGLAIVWLLVIGEMSWIVIPSCLLMVSGGVVGVVVQVTRDVFTARLLLRWAWACTVPGLVLFALVADLARPR